jgi:hypothetical protein
MPQSLVTDLTPAQVGVFGGVQGARAMFGDSADRLIANNFDPGVLRPFIGPDGNNYMTLNAGTPQERTVVTNAPATLTWEAWKAFDDAIIRAIQDELRLFADIRAAGLELNIPNGMGHTVLQYQTSGDIGPATISMDPIRRSEGDQPTKDSALLPLPCTHKDFDFSARQIAVSQNGRIPMPVDTDTAALAAHQVAVATEQLTAGTIGSFSYGGGTIYGYTNFPNRATKTDMPVPTGANGPAVISALLALRQMLIDDKHRGPYILYLNSQWAEFLDNDFSTAKGDQTLRQRILAIEGIQDVRISNYLPTTQFRCLLVEMKVGSVRAVIGMEPQMLQWESMGGLMKHFKVICIHVIQLRPDTAGNSGIADGRTP